MGRAISTTGASYKLWINNRIIGIATGFEWTSDPGRRPIYGLDQMQPFELAPGPSTITGRVDCIRVRDDGGLEGRGIAASDRNQTLEKYISIMLIDRVSDKVVFRCDQAAVNSQTWRVEAKGLLRGSFSFSGITWINESES